jgi:hypothetical protein
VYQENAFTEYKLSQEEITQGTILSYQQKMVIQNLRSQAAQQLLGIRFDPLNPTEAALEHASLSGMMTAFATIIENSDNAVRLLAERAAQQAKSQQDNDSPSS